LVDDHMKSSWGGVAVVARVSRKKLGCC